MSTEVRLVNGARLVVDNGSAGLLLTYDGGAPNPDGSKRNCYLEAADVERLCRALADASRERWGEAVRNLTYPAIRTTNPRWRTYRRRLRALLRERAELAVDAACEGCHLTISHAAGLPPEVEAVVRAAVAWKHGHAPPGALFDDVDALLASPEGARFRKEGE